MLVRDLLTADAFEVRLLAGGEGLDQPLRWVHVTDLPDPSAYLRGGELILTNGLWRTSADDSPRFVAALMRSGVHALGYAVEHGASTPPDLVAACERIGLPLFEVPDIPFMRISEEVGERILRERDHGARAGDARVAGRIAEAATIEQALISLAERCDAPAWTIDRAGLVHAAHPLPARDAAALWRAAFTGAPPPAGWNPHGRTIRSLAGRPSGSPAVLVVETPAGGELQPLLDVAVATIATLAGADAADREHARRAAGGALADDPAAAVAGLGTPEVVLLLSASAGEPEAAAVAIADAIEAVGRLDGVRPVVGLDGPRLLAAMPAAGGDDGNDLARRCHDAAVAVTGEPVAMAFAPVGRERLGDPGAVAAARRSAEGASRWAARLQPQSALVDARDVGGTALVVGVLPAGLRASLLDAVLGDLITYDAAHQSDLVDTLRAFLDEGGRWTETARRLHVHVNTLRYRVSRIEEITGRSLSSTAGRSQLHLALAAADLLPAAGDSRQPPAAGD